MCTVPAEVTSYNAIAWMAVGTGDPDPKKGGYDYDSLFRRSGTHGHSIRIESGQYTLAKHANSTSRAEIFQNVV